MSSPPNPFSIIPEITFLKAHEKLIIVLVLVVGALVGTSKGLNAWYSVEKLRVDQLATRVAEDQKQIAASQQAVLQLQQSAAQDKATLAASVQATQAQNERLSAANASLAAQNLALAKSTAAQQVKDTTLTLPQLGTRLTQLVPNVDPHDFAISADGRDATVGTDTAQKVVAQLELVPDLQKQNANLTTENVNLTVELSGEQKLSAEQTTYEAILEKEVGAQQAEIAAQQKTIVDSQALCNQQVAAAKAEGDKKLVTGLKWGGVIGAIVGIFIHAAL